MNNGTTVQTVPFQTRLYSSRLTRQGMDFIGKASIYEDFCVLLMLHDVFYWELNADQTMVMLRSMVEQGEFEDAWGYMSTWANEASSAISTWGNLGEEIQKLIDANQCPDGWGLEWMRRVNERAVEVRTVASRVVREMEAYCHDNGRWVPPNVALLMGVCGLSEA